MNISNTNTTMYGPRSTSKMTYIVTGGALISTHSMGQDSRWLEFMK